MGFAVTGEKFESWWLGFKKFVAGFLGKKFLNMEKKRKGLKSNF